jgi:hypothetical protein
MNELINRVFQIWAYTVSHCFLLLRSPLKFPDQDGFDENHSYNIDIEFSAVAYIDIPTLLSGIEITELINNIPEKFQQFKTDQGYKIFQLKSNEKNYYIVAGSYRIGKNKWVAEDRVLNMNLGYDSIIATS